MRKSVLALTSAAFGMGISEFVLVGLLPILSHSFAVSIPHAGLLVSGYALSVTFGSPLLALAVGRLNRKHSLLVLMAVFSAGNLLCALAPTFGILLAARVITALCQGAFYGIGSVVAASLVPREERARAIALMFTGLTLANILGVPAGTALGLRFGWRAAFWALVPVGLFALALILRFVPAQTAEPRPLREELRAVLHPPVLLVLGLSTLSSVSMFCVLTYISPMLQNLTHLSPAAVTWALMLFGFGITIGTLIGGHLSDWRPMATIVGGYALVAAVFLAMPAALHWRGTALAIVTLWGVVHFCAGSPLQPRVVDKAHGANLASTLNQSAFNFGNALGASLGGLLLTRGFDYGVLPLASSLLAACTVGLGLVTVTVERRERRHTQTAVPVP